MNSNTSTPEAVGSPVLSEQLGLVERLRQLSRHQHSDTTIGDEAAEEIESADATIEALRGAVIGETARADALHALCIDYAVMAGEFSKHFTPGDPLWIELRDLGERLDSLA